MFKRLLLSNSKTKRSRDGTPKTKTNESSYKSISKTCNMNTAGFIARTGLPIKVFTLLVKISQQYGIPIFARLGLTANPRLAQAHVAYKGMKIKAKSTNRVAHGLIPCAEQYHLFGKVGENNQVLPMPRDKFPAEDDYHTTDYCLTLQELLAAVEVGQFEIVVNESDSSKVTFMEVNGPDVAKGIKYQLYFNQPQAVKEQDMLPLRPSKQQLPKCPAWFKGNNFEQLCQQSFPVNYIQDGQAAQRIRVMAEIIDGEAYPITCDLDLFAIAIPHGLPASAYQVVNTLKDGGKEQLKANLKELLAHYNSQHQYIDFKLDIYLEKITLTEGCTTAFSTLIIYLINQNLKNAFGSKSLFIQHGEECYNPNKDSLSPIEDIAIFDGLNIDHCSTKEAFIDFLCRIYEERIAPRCYFPITEHVLKVPELWEYWKPLIKRQVIESHCREGAYRHPGIDEAYSQQYTPPNSPRQKTAHEAGSGVELSKTVGGDARRKIGHTKSNTPELITPRDTTGKRELLLNLIVKQTDLNAQDVDNSAPQADHVNSQPSNGPI